ncbi:MAG TPA: hypothetical protein VJ804_03495 [Acidimicrobiales bacterium]|nr:hypothetical protein [Acidimicrobiales bacterium]
MLLPPYLQNRREHRPGDSIASFRHQLSVLERATPEGRARSVAQLDARREWAAARASAQAVSYAHATATTPYRPSSRAVAHRTAVARKRRRDVFLTLLGAVGVTFLLAFAMGGMVWMLHLLVDAAFIGYVALLVKIQQDAAEKEIKVRFLEPAPALRSVEQPLLRRVGS